SSRRRHTRFSRDWSSDVCSSDLPYPQRENLGNQMGGARLVQHHSDLRIPVPIERAQMHAPKRVRLCLVVASQRNSLRRVVQTDTVRGRSDGKWPVQSLSAPPGPTIAMHCDIVLDSVVVSHGANVLAQSWLVVRQRERRRLCVHAGTVPVVKSQPAPVFQQQTTIAVSSVRHEVQYGVRPL